MNRAIAIVLAAFSGTLWAQQADMPKAPQVQGLDRSAVAAMNDIDPEKIRAHVRFLADDLLEGRGTGARGGDIAAQYIATQFALYGLKPAGDNGSYLQNVPMVSIQTKEGTTFSINAKNGETLSLRRGDDFVAANETLTPESTVNAPIVFVGYGINAPEYNWNDYAGVDVKGKVVMMFVNEPPSPQPSTDDNFFKGRALTYYGRWTYKYEEAARQGAAGAILIHQTQMASYGWDVVKNSWGGERSYLADNPKPKLKLASWIQLDVARKLFADSGLDLDKVLRQIHERGFKAIPLGATLDARIVSSVRPFKGYNVVARLDGSSKRDEAVLYTAHYDHLGIHPDEPGDNIYNGAADNATGCGILLELARVFAESAQRPQRSILFSSVTAEEQGLLGSQYLGEHPPIPARNIVLDLNYDDIQPWGVPEELEVAGSERTDFYPTVEEVARDFKMEIKPDAFPEAGHYYRSDHFSLARVGIPSFSIGEGLKFVGHDEAWGKQKAEYYVAHDYHHPSDEYKPEMDFRSDARVAQVGFALGWKAANSSSRIGWKPGDEFENARKGGQ